MAACELSFAYPYLGQIENPPAWTRDPRTGIAQPGYGCGGLLDHDNDYMMSISGIILHELIHWSFLLRDIPNFNDYTTEAPGGQKKIPDWDGPFPEDGYGPYNAFLINNLTANQARALFHSLNNADSYFY